MDAEIVGSLAGFLTTIAFIPQVLRAWRTRSTKDISLGMFLVFTAGVALWLTYGILLNKPPIIAANIATLMLSLSILVLKLRHG